MLAATGAQFEVLGAQGGFEDEEVEVDLRRGGGQMREGIGDAGGWDVGLRNIYRGSAFHYLVQPCFGHVGRAAAPEVLGDLNRSGMDGCYKSIAGCIERRMWFVKLNVMRCDGDGDGDEDSDAMPM